ncbi:MAG: hypothetical protein K0R46_3413 [Herbinix sp.]|jgi:hypothetical protein|nr:hypothetical protein [Herbinix sp.]
MAFSNVDRTKEVEKEQGVVRIKSTDHCHYYEKHPDTFLQRKECWTCIYSDFGINTGNPSDTGVCEYNKDTNRLSHNPLSDSKEQRR